MAFYLDHQAEIDAQLVADDQSFMQLQAEQQAQHPERVADWKRRREAIRI